MKSKLIAVCASIVALIAVHPAFATDAPKPNKTQKSASRPVRVAHVSAKSKPTAKPKPKPRVVAAKPPPPKHPWVGRTVTISPSERDVIRAYVRSRMDASKGGKFNGVSQGMTRKVTWGWGKLPDGWEKRCLRGQVLPNDIHKRCHGLPDDVIVHLPPPPPGTVLLAVNGRVIRVGYPTYEILDTFDVLPTEPFPLRAAKRSTAESISMARR